MTLQIELYELSGDGPIQTVDEQLRRIEQIDENMVEKTMASTLQPFELNVEFEAIFRSVLPMGGQVQRQKSLTRILHEEFEQDRNVIYGKITIRYRTNFSVENEYVADYSLKFTYRDEFDYETKDFLPWEDENIRAELGG
jgi:hypothetical protein